MVQKSLAMLVSIFLLLGYASAAQPAPEDKWIGGWHLQHKADAFEESSSMDADILTDEHGALSSLSLTCERPGGGSFSVMADEKRKMPRGLPVAALVKIDDAGPLVFPASAAGWFPGTHSIFVYHAASIFPAIATARRVGIRIKYLRGDVDFFWKINATGTGPAAMDNLAPGKKMLEKICGSP